MSAACSKGWRTPERIPTAFPNPSSNPNPNSNPNPTSNLDTASLQAVIKHKGSGIRSVYQHLPIICLLACHEVINLAFK